METFSQARLWQLIAPICEMGEYHWFHREKVEVYMGELYNKIGLGLFTWSPVSYGLSIGKAEETTELLIKLLLKVRNSAKDLSDRWRHDGLRNNASSMVSC